MVQVELELKAKNLPKTDFVGASDPFFVVSFNGKELYKSEVIDNNLNPEWAKAVFELPEEANPGTVQVEIRDKDGIGSESMFKVDVDYPFSINTFKLNDKEEPAELKVCNMHGHMSNLGKKVGCLCFGKKKKAAPKE